MAARHAAVLSRPATTRSSRAGAAGADAVECAGRREPARSGGDALSTTSAGSRRADHPSGPARARQWWSWNAAAVIRTVLDVLRDQRHARPTGSLLSLRVSPTALPGLSAPRDMARRVLRSDEYERQPHF